MCAYCKDVRDPLGRWVYVNQGLLDRLEYRLSHGICPGCIRKHFPEFSSRLLENEKPRPLARPGP